MSKHRNPIVHFYPRNSHDELRGLLLFVVTDADIVAGQTEGLPRDVEPAGAGQELVGILTVAEERDQVLELSWIFGTDVGSLAL